MARGLSWSDVRGGLIATLIIVLVSVAILKFSRVGALHGKTISLYSLVNEARGVTPGSEVWLVWGDGACGYGLAEFDTFVRHGMPVIAVVGNDAGWTQIAREQVKMLGDDVGTVLSRTAYHEVARGFGAEGLEIRGDAEVAAVLARARDLAAAGRPVLVNVWLDKTEFREGSISM